MTIRTVDPEKHETATIVQSQTGSWKVYAAGALRKTFETELGAHCYAEQMGYILEESPQ